MSLTKSIEQQQLDIQKCILKRLEKLDTDSNGSNGTSSSDYEDVLDKLDEVIEFLTTSEEADNTLIQEAINIRNSVNTFARDNHTDLRNLQTIVTNLNDFIQNNWNIFRQIAGLVTNIRDSLNTFHTNLLNLETVENQILTDIRDNQYSVVVIKGYYKYQNTTSFEVYIDIAHNMLESIYFTYKNKPHRMYISDMFLSGYHDNPAFIKYLSKIFGCTVAIKNEKLYFSRQESLVDFKFFRQTSNTSNQLNPVTTSDVNYTYSYTIFMNKYEFYDKDKNLVESHYGKNLSDGYTNSVSEPNYSPISRPSTYFFAGPIPEEKCTTLYFNLTSIPLSNFGIFCKDYKTIKVSTTPNTDSIDESVIAFTDIKNTNMPVLVGATKHLPYIFNENTSNFCFLESVINPSTTKTYPLTVEIKF